jgi:hypothetical protein
VDAIDFLGLGGLLAGKLGVSARAVQNALAQISLKGTPSMAVVMRFTREVGDVMFGREPAEVAEARDRAIRTCRLRHWLRRRGDMEGGNRLRPWLCVQKLVLLAVARG